MEKWKQWLDWASKEYDTLKLREEELQQCLDDAQNSNNADLIRDLEQHWLEAHKQLRSLNARIRDHIQHMPTPKRWWRGHT